MESLMEETHSSLPACEPISFTVVKRLHFFDARAMHGPLARRGGIESLRPIPRAKQPDALAVPRVVLPTAEVRRASSHNRVWALTWLETRCVVSTSYCGELARCGVAEMFL
jgi:hypothetical protein